MCATQVHKPSVCAAISMLPVQREEARQARLERERKKQEAERLAKQEEQRLEKERLREKARIAKETAEKV
jgi:hypothetical protein